MQDRISNILNRSGEPQKAAIDLQRFRDAYQSNSGREPKMDSVEGETITRIFGNSPVLTNRLIQNPNWFDEITRSEFLGKTKTRGTIESELKDMLATNDAEFGTVLRKYKYREMLRLVAMDLSQTISVPDMLSEWSDIADCIVDICYKRAFDMVAARMGRKACTGVIIALGKLGSRELNLSSDIDILELYESDEDPNYHEFHVKLVVELTQMLSTVNEHGFIYRVDHELRPEGIGGALANSLDAAIRYYEYFGQNWERLAMIRARPIAGDIQLGKRFISAISPFVYRKTLSIKDLTKMRAQKEEIYKGLTKRSDEIDIKHGIGGIREIEFISSILQGLYGGHKPKIREANTFKAISLLSQGQLMHPHTAKRLTEALKFLRRTEGMLQAITDTQTYTLGTSDAALAPIAQMMGYSGGNSVRQFSTDLNEHMNFAHDTFSALFESDYDYVELKNALRDSVESAVSAEEEADSLAWFKRHEFRRLARLDMEGKLDINELNKKLTLTAEVVLTAAKEIAYKRLGEKYGAPISTNGKVAELAIIGMGKLGSVELDYGSDLDIIFIYSSDGTTDGRRNITNSEFFTRLAQRIITMISMSTRYGRAYTVDSELRPSGNSGVLVTSLDAFCQYHRREQSIWERLTLLKARNISLNESLAGDINKALEEIAYGAAIPDKKTIKDEIYHLRNRFLDEVAKPSLDLIDLKLGKGGLCELEAIIQYHQLLNLSTHRELWIQNTFAVLNELREDSILGDDYCHNLMDQLAFFRKVISRLRLITRSSKDTLQIDSHYAGVLSKQFGFESRDMFIDNLRQRMSQIRNIFSDL